jgi:hypothetical protein
MAVSDGTPPGDAGAGDAGAPPAPQAPAAQTPAAARPSPSAPSARAPLPSTPAANGGAEDVLRTFVRSSVEKILKEAPWTFHKVNPLKEACRQFLREVDEEVAVEPKARTPGGGARDVSKEREGTMSSLETTTTTKTRRLALSATRALVAACDSGRAALAEPALGAAHKLVAGGFLVGTTNARGSLVRESRERNDDGENDGDDDDATTDISEKRNGATDDADDDAKTRAKTRATTTDTDSDDTADGSCRALVDALCACASAIPDGSSLSSGSSSGSAQTYAVAAVGALLACAVSEHLRLEGESLADALSALLRVCASVSSPETRAAAKTATTQLINVAFQRAGGFANVVTFANVADSETPPTPLTPREADALLVLLTLCERAAVPGSGEEKARAAETRRRARGAEASSPDPFAAMATAFQPAAAALVAAETRSARTRAVSLDLLRQLLEGPGSKAWLVRLAPFLGKPLRLALGAGVDVEGAGASSGFSRFTKTRASAPATARADPATAATASLARAAFTSLVLRARHAYKPAVARLYPRMALAPLEGPSRGGGGGAAEDAKAKLAALRVIRALASDPQVLVDVFVNHDCDARGDNLYERTIGALASTMAPGGGDQQRLRDGAVQCVLATVQSLRVWHARGAEPTPTPLFAGGSESLGTRRSGGGTRAEREPGSDREASATIANGMEITPGGARAAFEETRFLELERGHEEKLSSVSETRALTESETFASLKKRKATFEAATSAFNARPSVTTLATVMEISREDMDDETIDVTDSRFPKRAAAFLVGRDAFFGDDVDPVDRANARKQNADDVSLEKKRTTSESRLDPTGPERGG